MRPLPISMATLRVLVIGWAVPLTAQQAPCAQITAACTSAGFTQGGASTGTGLQKGCVIPIMQGIAQPAGATRLLPQVDPQLVAACKARRPDFGQLKVSTLAADIQPAPAGAAPPSATPVSPSAIPLTAQQGPCAQITAACQSAGFTQGGVSTGSGLQLHCVIPIMQGTAQPAVAARPLPQVAPDVVAACKARNPRFGQRPISAAAQATPTVSAKAPKASAATVLDGGLENPQATSGEAPPFPPAADGQIVYDSRLNVSWLSDGNLAAKETFGVSGINKSGSMDYATAVRWVLALNAFNKGGGYLGHHNWQLPTTPNKDSHCDRTGLQGESFGYHCSGSSLGSLYYNTLGIQEPNDAVPIPYKCVPMPPSQRPPSERCGPGPTPTAGPFSNFQPYLYWSKSAAPKAAQGFKTFSFNTGFQGSNVSRNHLYVLPMFKGKLPGTTPLGGSGGLQISPDGQTVYDPGSQVTWLANANLAAEQTFGVAGINADGSMEHTTALLWVDAMNKADHGHGYLGVAQWDLPETGPSDPSCSMQGATSFGFDCTASPMGHLYYRQLGLLAGEPVVSYPDVKVGPFHDIQPYLYWACTGETAQSACQAKGPASGFEWSFSFGNGFEGTDVVGNYFYTIVYFPAPLTPSHRGLVPLRPGGG